MWNTAGPSPSANVLTPAAKDEVNAAYHGWRRLENLSHGEYVAVPMVGQGTFWYLQGTQLLIVLSKSVMIASKRIQL